MKHKPVMAAVAGALVALLALSACGGGEDAKMVMIGYGGDLAKPYEEFLIKPFLEKHKGVELTQVPSESGDFVAQIKAAAKASPYDAIPLGESRLVTAIEEGWIAPISEADAPVLAEQADIFKDACQGYGVPATYSLIGIAYNPYVVPAPTSWADMWNEEYSGHVGIVSSSSNLGFAFFVEAAKLAGGGEANLDVGFDKIAELGDFTVAGSPEALAQLFETGEIAIAPLWNNDAAVLKASGMSVEFVRPSEGAIADVTCMAMTTKTAYKDLTLELLNDVGGVTYQEAAAAAPWYFGPTNKNAVVAPSEYLVSDEAEFNTLMRIDWQVAAPSRNDITDQFNQRFGG
ncbi:MAG: extracellular solute-binding protein [Bifidobacteriaceae bacterium]|jgi:putative spermidine/putrescine transport system substrate-binding protein|nr:extracellular solute-binding protein [Bifidobacteriaceae bacterium]